MEATLMDLAAMVGGNLNGDPEKLIFNTASFEMATEDDITYAAGASYLKKINECSAGAVIVPLGTVIDGVNTIDAASPEGAFAKVKMFFHKPESMAREINESAYIGLNLIFGSEVAIGPFAVIADNVTIGDRVSIFPGAYIGDNVVIGDDAVIYPNVTIGQNCIIGKRVSIHAGTVIGSDGFGYTQDEGKTIKIPHTGIVHIEDDVEIGALNTVDRAVHDKTLIKQGVKTDNMVHIAHNVIVGERTLIMAHAGISGSVEIGTDSIIGGQSGVVDHVKIGDMVYIAPRTAVVKSVETGESVGGTPALPYKLALKVIAAIPKLPGALKRLASLEKKVEAFINSQTQDKEK